MPMPLLAVAIALSPVLQDTARAARDTARPRQLAPIVVTVTRSALDPMASPLPTAQIGASQLARDGRVSVSAVVGTLPGVRALTTGEQIGKPVIRGLSGARVLVLDGSHRLEDYSWSDEDGPSVDPRLAERIEVIRGPASLLYGSDAIGGVINAIPQEVPVAAPGERLLRFRAEASGATNNINLGPAGSVEYARGSYGLRADVIGRFAGNIHTPAGEIENTGFFAFNGAAAFGIRGSRGSLTVRLARFGGEFRLHEASDTAAAPAAGGEEGPERITGDTRLQVDGQTLWRGLRLEARAQIQSHGIIEKSDEGCNPSPCTPGNETETFNLALLTTNFDVLAHHTSGAFDGTFGISGMVSRNDTRGVVPLVPDAHSSSAAFFIVERVSVSRRLSVLAGVRQDARSLSADANAGLGLSAQTRDASAITGDVGVVVRAGDHVAVAANVGRAFRAPNLFELFSNGPRLGEARYEVGSAALVPEVSLNLDASLRWQSGRFRGDVAAYRNRIEDFIFITPTSTMRFDSTSGDSLREYDYLQTTALLVGGEASAEFDATPMLTFGASADLVRGSIVGSNDPLPLMPPPRVVLRGLLHERPDAARRWYAGLEVENVARQTRLARFTIPGQGSTAFDIPTGSYALVGLQGGCETHVGSRAIEIDARVRNLANTAYRNYLNRYKEFALDAGRSLELRVATAF